MGYWGFEEPVQHHHIKAVREVAPRLDITVSAGEETYTLAGLAIRPGDGRNHPGPKLGRPLHILTSWRVAAASGRQSGLGIL
jgi:hypothetical protein